MVHATRRRGITVVIAAVIVGGWLPLHFAGDSSALFGKAAQPLAACPARLDSDHPQLANDGSDLTHRLVPATAPTGVSICQYTTTPGSDLTPALARTIALTAPSAAHLAQVISEISLTSEPKSGLSERNVRTDRPDPIQLLRSHSGYPALRHVGMPAPDQRPSHRIRNREPQLLQRIHATHDAGRRHSVTQARRRYSEPHADAQADGR